MQGGDVNWTVGQVGPGGGQEAAQGRGQDQGGCARKGAARGCAGCAGCALRRAAGLYRLRQVCYKYDWGGRERDDAASSAKDRDRVRTGGRVGGKGVLRFPRPFPLPFPQFGGEALTPTSSAHARSHGRRGGGGSSASSTSSPTRDRHDLLIPL